MVFWVRVPVVVLGVRVGSRGAEQGYNENCGGSDGTAPPRGYTYS